MTRPPSLRLWARWVVANVAAEILGLGADGLVGLGLISQWGEPAGARAVAFAALLVAVGTLEGVLVGLGHGAFSARALPGRLGRLHCGGRGQRQHGAGQHAQDPGQEGASVLGIAARVLWTIGAAGAIVGAVHGTVLVKMLRQREPAQGQRL
jgi:hypothetical protein